MNCVQAQQMFSDYIEGELEEPLSVALQHHVSHCESCAHELSALKDLWPSFGSLDVVEPPSDLHANIMLQISGMQKSKEAVTRISLWDVFTGKKSIFSRKALAVFGAFILLMVASIQFVPAGHNWVTALITPGITRETAPISHDEITLNILPRPVENGVSTLSLTIRPGCDVEKANVSVKMIKGIHETGETVQNANWNVNLVKQKETTMSVALPFPEAGMRTLLVKVTGNDGKYRVAKKAFLPVRSLEEADMKVGATSLDLDSHNMDIYDALAFLSMKTKTPIIMDTDLHGKVDINLNGDRLGSALSKVLTPLGYTWNAASGVYVVRNVPNTK